jgi:hypothetical protein
VEGALFVRECEDIFSVQKESVGVGIVRKDFVAGGDLKRVHILRRC